MGFVRGTLLYKVNEAFVGTEHTLLFTETKRLWHFVKGADFNYKTRKEMMFYKC